jgi:epoxyqueuosine reductase QueG
MLSASTLHQSAPRYAADRCTAPTSPPQRLSADGSQRSADALVFGCGICQDVLPWNRFAQPTTEAAFLARDGLDGGRLIERITITQEELSRRFQDSSVTSADGAHQGSSFPRTRAVALAWFHEYARSHDHRVQYGI